MSTVRKGTYQSLCTSIPYFRINRTIGRRHSDGIARRTRRLSRYNNGDTFAAVACFNGLHDHDISEGDGTRLKYQYSFPSHHGGGRGRQGNFPRHLPYTITHHRAETIKVVGNKRHLRMGKLTTYPREIVKTTTLTECEMNSSQDERVRLRILRFHPGMGIAPTHSHLRKKIVRPTDRPSHSSYTYFHGSRLAHLEYTFAQWGIHSRPGRRSRAGAGGGCAPR